MIALLAALLLPADTIPAPVQPSLIPERASASALLVSPSPEGPRRNPREGAAAQEEIPALPLPVSRFMPEPVALAGSGPGNLFIPRSPSEPTIGGGRVAGRRGSVRNGVTGPVGTEGSSGVRKGMAGSAEEPGASGSPSEPPQLVEYSDAYLTRLKIHKYASYATLPLFAAAYVTGNELITKGPNAASWARNTHGAIAGSLGALFAINTITGVWNLYEGRNDPEGRTRRIIHSVLLLAADAGFLATAALAGESEGGEGGGDYGERGDGDNTAHRAMAITSMGLAFTGYMTMSWPFRRD